LRSCPKPEATAIQRTLVLGLFILLLPILPALNLNALNPGDFLHGRYTYLPLAGLMIVLVAGFHLTKKGRVIVLTMAGLVGIAFAVLTVKQEGQWKDDLTVFTVAHGYAPNSGPVGQSLVRTHVQAALDLDEAGHCDQAMPSFEDAIR